MPKKKKRKCNNLMWEAKMLFIASSQCELGSKLLRGCLKQNLGVATST